MYVRRTGTRRDAMRWTRLTPAAGGADPTRAAAPARASPAGPPTRARAGEGRGGGPGSPGDRGHRRMPPKRLATPAATPLRARPIMKSTPTLRIAVDDDVAPRRSMKGLGSEVRLEAGGG